MAIYRTWSRPLVAYALTWSGNDQRLAEGYVDHAFHELYLGWSELGARSQSELYSWLRLVVRNKAVDDYRRRSRVGLVDPLEDGDLLDRPAVDGGAADLCRSVLARDLYDQCLRVIRRMPEAQRIAILLRGEGQNSRQIAEHMGVDASTVRGHWKKVREDLTIYVGHVIRILDSESDELNTTGPGRGSA
ncbi:RNA polymerase sigma factor [Cryptosporangium sp. NPDC048952]|uniref:RNA polymerase sigma factor n=1 Tax=Cryptosporangium sp. NPDC048952 TaxID=3363961 RepID=UPI00371D2404